jgi:two-component system sensor histidine kinase PrrB
MRSLRGRLTLGVLLLLAAVLVAAGAAAFHEIDASERAALDDRLKRTAELTRPTAVAAVQQEVPADDPRLDAVLRATGSSLPVRLGRITLVHAGPTPPTHGALPRGLSTFSSDGRRYRAYVTTLSDPDLGGRARLEVVSSLAGLEDRVDELERRVALIGLVGLLVVGIAVWLIASVVLRPLRRLRMVTASIPTTRTSIAACPLTAGRRSCARWHVRSTRCSRGWDAAQPTASARSPRRGALPPMRAMSCVRR